MRPTLGKDKILVAAVKLFAGQGFHRTSVSQIAAAAGVSKGLLYNYYASKEALLLAIIADASTGMGEVAESLSAAAPLGRHDYQKSLQSFLNSFKVFLTENREFLCFQLSLMFQPDLREIVAAPLNARAEALLDTTRTMFDRAGVAAPEMTARRLLSELDGIALHHLAVFNDYPLEPMLAELYLNYKDLARG